MATFKEISASLDSVLQDIQSKKVVLDAANLAASKASSDYTIAVNSAQDLRQQLYNSMEINLGPFNNNVKVFSPKTA